MKNPRNRLLAWAMLGLLAAMAPAEARRPAPGGSADSSQHEAAWRLHSAMQEQSLFRGLQWRSIGPVVQGGRVIDVESVPGSPYTFYVAYASGGLWKTTNNGVSFEPLFDDQPTIIMGDVAVDPTRPETVWVGTGEDNSSRSSYGGLGVFRSDDGGRSWRNTGLKDSDRIGRIVIDPRNPDRVFVAALGRLYTPGGQRGIYLTEDGGQSWQRVLEGDSVTGFVDLVMAPDNPDVLYAAAWERSRRPWNFVEGGQGSAIWKSSDGGRSWRKLGGGLPAGEFVGRIGLSVSASNPDIVYASVDNQAPLPEEQWDLGDRPLSAKRLRNMSRDEFLRQDPEEIEMFIRSNDLDTDLDAKKLIEMIREDKITVSDLLKELDDANANLFNVDIRGLEVYRSDDAGDTWRITHDQPLREVVYSYGYYFGQIRVAPNDPDRVYVLGVPLILSEDGGATWSGIMGNEMHADLQAMWIDPEYPDRVIAGNDGGIDISYDGGKSWLRMDAQPVGQFYTIAVDMADPYNVYGGLQDNGTLKGSSKTRWEDGPSWTRINGGDGMYVSVDPRDNKTTYTGFQFGYYTRIGGDGKRSTVRPRDALGEAALRYNWNTPVILSPHNPDIVYFGANRLYRSLDQGDTWSAISDDLSKSKHRGDVPYGTITTISESQLTFGLIWTGTDDGQVKVTEDGGVDWRDAGDGLPRDRWVSRVEASSHVTKRAYVSLNGYRDDDPRAYLFVTENLGRSWRNIAAGLPMEAINVVREDPVNSDVLYVGTDRGVYVSQDRGDSWQSLQAGLPNVPVHDLVVHPRERELVAGTHGRSVWIVDVLPVQELTPELQAKGVHVFSLEDVKASRSWRGKRSLWRHRSEYDPSLKVPYWAAAEGEIDVAVLDDKERPVMQTTVRAMRGVNTFTWDLIMDEALALAAEQARNAEKSTEDEAGMQASDEAKTLASTPVAEAIRLEHPLYIVPGKYQVRFSAGEQTAETALEVKAPEPLQPRSRPEPEIRGRGK